MNIEALDRSKADDFRLGVGDSLNLELQSEGVRRIVRRSRRETSFLLLT